MISYSDEHERIETRRLANVAILKREREDGKITSRAGLGLSDALVLSEQA